MICRSAISWMNNVHFLLSISVRSVCALFEYDDLNLPMQYQCVNDFYWVKYIKPKLV
jgi:hypothetical protein